MLESLGLVLPHFTSPPPLPRAVAEDFLDDVPGGNGPEILRKPPGFTRSHPWGARTMKGLEIEGCQFELFAQHKSLERSLFRTKSGTLFLRNQAWNRRPNRPCLVPLCSAQSCRVAGPRDRILSSNITPKGKTLTSNATKR